MDLIDEVLPRSAVLAAEEKLITLGRIRQDLLLSMIEIVEQSDAALAAKNAVRIE